MASALVGRCRCIQIAIMVKADLSRDYYGDLELQPDASENDIKKQFKKLGM